jgi:hypothetical protein
MIKRYDGPVTSAVLECQGVKTLPRLNHGTITVVRDGLRTKPPRLSLQPENVAELAAREYEHALARSDQEATVNDAGYPSLASSLCGRIGYVPRPQCPSTQSAE